MKKATEKKLVFELRNIHLTNGTEKQKTWMLNTAFANIAEAMEV